MEVPMIIHGWNIKNQYVEFTDVCLDFSKIGLYLVTGDNGSGKSTLIKSIMFGNECPEFSNAQWREAFHKARYKLIGYVSQDDVDTSDTVWEFLSKHNLVSSSKAHALMDAFHLQEIEFSKRFAVLSGGEKRKLMIVSALIKETPYVVLDEPTNSLDDQSVASLIDLLTREAALRTVILVSHDPRLKDITKRTICVTRGTIVQNHGTTGADSNEVHVIRNLPVVSPKRFLWRGMHYKGQFAWMLVLFLGFGLLAMLNHFLYYIGYAVNEAPKSNQILIQSVDRAYTQLNEKYVIGEHLEIDATRIHHLIAYDDIPTIATLIGIQKIYMADIAYISAYYRGDDDGIHRPFFVFSIPSIVSGSTQISGFLSDPELFYLEMGRLPYDGEHEVAISANMLSQHYGFDVPASAMNQMIEIDQTHYRVVGILFEDIAIVSYEINDGYGIYVYQVENYSSFKSKQIEFLTMEQAYLNVDSLLVETIPGFERSVLNRLIQTYPANNYVSNHFVLMFNHTHNRQFQLAMWLTNTGVSIALAVIYALGTKSKIKTQAGRIVDYENYYVDAFSVRRVFLLQSMVYYLLLLGFGLIISLILGLFTQLNSIIVWNLIVSYAIIVLPVAVMLERQLKHVRR